MKAATLASVVLLGGLLIATETSAQQGQGQAPNQGSIVAVIDVAKVFDNHSGFKSKMDAIREEVKQFEDDMKRQRDAILEEAARLNQLQAGSPDYKQLEATLAKREADLQIQAGQKRKDVLDREAAIYLQTYGEVVDRVTQLAEYNNIALVIRYDSSEIDPTDRGSVIKGVNRNVVYNAGWDLTEPVIKMVNPQQANQGNGIR